MCIRRIIPDIFQYRHGPYSETEPDLIESQIRFFFLYRKKSWNDTRIGIIPTFAFYVVLYSWIMRLMELAGMPSAKEMESMLRSFRAALASGDRNGFQILPSQNGTQSSPACCPVITDDCGGKNQIFTRWTDAERTIGITIQQFGKPLPAFYGSFAPKVVGIVKLDVFLANFQPAMCPTATGQDHPVFFRKGRSFSCQGRASAISA